MFKLNLSTLNNFKHIVIKNNESEYIESSFYLHAFESRKNFIKITEFKGDKYFNILILDNHSHNTCLIYIIILK